MDIELVYSHVADKLRGTVHHIPVAYQHPSQITMDRRGMDNDNTAFLSIVPRPDGTGEPRSIDKGKLRYLETEWKAFLAQANLTAGCQRRKRRGQGDPAQSRQQLEEVGHTKHAVGQHEEPKGDEQQAADQPYGKGVGTE